MKRLILGLSLTLCFHSVIAEEALSTQDQLVFRAFSKNFNKFKEQEYYSGASLSYAIPQQSIQNFYLGNVSHDKNSPLISKSTLFEIGSITKSFTSALILQQNQNGQLELNDTLQKWLPRYAKWNNVSIRSMLNMTSGLPNYTETPKMNSDFGIAPAQAWTDAQLIDLVYPRENFSPPLKTGYFYSNTNFILLGLILEKISHEHFQELITQKIIQPAGLKNTFYPVPTVPDAVQTRLASGYSYNQYYNPDLLGKDLRDNDLSWAGAAGALVSNSEDVIQWVKALFIENKILAPNQKKKLMTVVSQETGKPIQEVSVTDSHAFGLGVAKVFDKTEGVFWFYEGQTLGFRAAYLYHPCNGVIVSVILNSATNEENDHMKNFLMDTYNVLIKQHVNLRCQR